MKKANHQANIVQIKATDIKPHTNADNLELIMVGDYQVVTRKGQFSNGILAVYIQPDSVVPQTKPFEFIWKPYLDDMLNDPSRCPHTDPENPNKETIIKGIFDLNGSVEEVCTRCMLHDPRNPKVPERRRRITVRRFRGEWSEGLLLPVSDFGMLPTHYRIGTEEKSMITICDWDSTNCEFKDYAFNVSDDVSDYLGITHYDPDTESTKGENSDAPKAKKKYPKTLSGWGKYLFRRVRNFFGIGGKLDGVQDTVKLDIPVYDVDAYKSRPATFTEGESVQYTEKIHGSNARYVFLGGVMYAGSRNLWKSPTSTCIFRKAVKELSWIEKWCRAHEGYVLWGEVTPTQKGYEYGSKKTQFFVFDIYKPDGKWAAKEGDDEDTGLWQGIETKVPLLYTGEYQGYDHAKSFADGPSTVPGAKNIREGIVVVSTYDRRERGGSRAQRKIVSNVFLEKDNK